MKRLLFLSGLWLIILQSPAIAQSPHLRVSALLNWPDSVYNGQNLPVGALVENIGTVSYQGPLQIVLQSDSGIFSYLYFNQTQSVLILPGDTLTFTPPNGYIFDSTVFRPGNNVVVVWPHSAQAITVDTFTVATYFIQNLLQNTDEVKALDGLKIYPNPASDKVHIRIPEIQLESVRILDPLGRQVKEIKMKASSDIEVPVADLPAGIYFLEIIATNKERSCYKLIKRE